MSARLILAGPGQDQDKDLVKKWLEPKGYRKWRCWRRFAQRAQEEKEN